MSTYALAPLEHLFNTGQDEELVLVVGRYGDVFAFVGLGDWREHDSVFSQLPDTLKATEDDYFRTKAALRDNAWLPAAYGKDFVQVLHWLAMRLGDWPSGYSAREERWDQTREFYKKLVCESDVHGNDH